MANMISVENYSFVCTFYHEFEKILNSTLN